MGNSEELKDLLSYHKLKLVYSRHKLIVNDTFETMSGWSNAGGDWHVMTVETNEDKSSGLRGDIAINSAGAWNGGAMQKTVQLAHYGEVIFENYLKYSYTDNDAAGDTPIGGNSLSFFIDSAKKLEVQGPSPWQRCIPIGIMPGKHILKFDYSIQGDTADNKGVVDTFMVWEGKEVDCLITEYTPPRPSKNIGSSKILRGFTRYQEMSVADTEIKFTALFNGHSFLEFMQKSDEPFYFVDEFGVCYRGIFPESIEPKSIAMNEVYLVSLTMLAGQKTGFGFC